MSDTDQTGGTMYPHPIKQTADFVKVTWAFVWSLLAAAVVLAAIIMAVR